MLICSSLYFVLRLWIFLYAQKLYLFSCLCQSFMVLWDSNHQQTKLGSLRISQSYWGTRSRRCRCLLKAPQTHFIPILWENLQSLSCWNLDLIWHVSCIFHSWSCLSQFAVTFVPCMLQNLLKYMHLWVIEKFAP